MNLRRSLSAIVVSALGIGTLAACSPGGGGGGGECVTDLRIVQASAGIDITATHARAASLLGGVAFTAYVGDYEIPAEEISFSNVPTPPAGSTLATIAITRFNVPEAPVIEAGDTANAATAPGELAFVVTVASDSGLAGNNVGSSGTVVVDSVGDTLCLTVDYSDDEKSVSGTVAAFVTTL